MRKPILLALIMAASLSLAAQKSKKKDVSLPDFGVVDKADLEMKACDFDDNAEALVLLDDGALDLVTGRGIEMKRRIRIKILNDKGLDWANVHLPYYSDRNLQDISGLEAQTYNLDDAGNIVTTKLEKKLVYEKKTNKKYSEKVFTFPEVRVGSIIEYKYKHEGIGLVDWYFQRSIPVQYSHFTVDYPEEIEIATLPFCEREYESKTEQKARRTVKSYTIKNVPGLRDEPYIINEDYYRDRLAIKITATNIQGRRNSQILNWLQVIRYLMEDEDFGLQIKKNIPRTAELDEKLKGLKAPYDRMKAVYKYVQENMQWNEYTGIWAFDGVKSAWKDKKGTLGEINLILVNLLKDAGLNVHPILVSSHANGVVNTADPGTYYYPGFNQFNKVMAYVTINGKEYVLDATQKNTPVHLMPADVLMTEGLVIEKIETGEWGWKTLWRDDQCARNTLVINGTIDEKGTMNGNMSITSFDYAKLARLGLVKKGKEGFIEKYVPASNPGLQVEDVVFENADKDSLPLVQKVTFSQALNTAGAYNYFSTNILTGLEKNPFVADNRSSDVFFGCRQSYHIVGSFTLPEGYELETLPKNIRMILPDTSVSISRMAQVNGNVLQTLVQIDFKKAIYPSGQYAELHEFYQRLFDILNEQFVMRKKVKS